MAVDRIGSITALLLVPWTLKWLWAPLVDWSSPWWSYRRWVISAQAVMGGTLALFALLDPERHFPWMIAVLLVHALAAATQDVSIDALCISTIEPQSRGSVNGWMQAGMLLGRALFGGGALYVLARVSLATTIAMLVAVLWSAAALLALWRPRAEGRPTSESDVPASDAGSPTRASDWLAIVRDYRTWLALAFALIGGAAYEGVGALLGPYLIDVGVTLESVGFFKLVPAPLALAIGALAGGRISDRFGHVRVTWCALAALIALGVTLGLVQTFAGSGPMAWRWCIITLQYAAVGTFTASSYALFMDLAAARWKATLFSTMTGATNACEAGSTYLASQLAVRFGFGPTFIMMVVPSVLGLAIVPWLGRRPREGA